MYDAQVTYTMGDFRELAKAMGRAEANWVIAKTNGKAKAIVFTENDLQLVVDINKGFQDEFKKCTTCKIVKEVEYVIDELGPKIQEKAQQALLQAPDANAMVLYYDDLITAGIGSAVKSSGRNDQIEVVAGGGFEANMEIMRENGGQDASYSFHVPWEGWSAVDVLNRVLAGEEPQGSGIGIGIIDREHNLGTSGAAPAPMDFRAAYRKAWKAGV
jgi:ribose transport system substrate-binding protein